MIDKAYVDTFEWVKKVAAVYIEGYEKFLRAAAAYPRISLTRPRTRRDMRTHGAKRGARFSIENLHRFATVEKLSDGQAVCVRAVRADDRNRLAAHFTCLSQASLYYRFLGTRGPLSDEELDRFTRLDFDQAALVITLEGSDEKIVGFTQYVRGQDSQRAQIACSVSDEYQNRGIGTLMFNRLSQVALANGIKEFEGDALADNQRVLAIAAKNGRQIRKSTEAGVTRICISLRRQRRAASRRVQTNRRTGLSPSQRKHAASGWLM